MFEIRACCGGVLGFLKRGDNYRYAYLRKPKMYLVVVAQFITTLVLAFFLIPFDINMAISVFVGGLCCGIPNAFLVWRMFRYSGASAARSIVISFYYGGVGKFFLTVAAFMFVFMQIKTVDVLPLFVAFIVVQLVGWFTPMWIE